MILTDELAVIRRNGITTAWWRIIQSGFDAFSVCLVVSIHSAAMYYLADQSYMQTQFSRPECCSLAVVRDVSVDDVIVRRTDTALSIMC